MHGKTHLLGVVWQPFLHIERVLIERALHGVSEGESVVAVDLHDAGGPSGGRELLDATHDRGRKGTNVPRSVGTMSTGAWEQSVAV